MRNDSFDIHYDGSRILAMRSLLLFPINPPLILDIFRIDFNVFRTDVLTPVLPSLMVKIKYNEIILWNQATVFV